MRYEEERVERLERLVDELRARVELLERGPEPVGPPPAAAPPPAPAPPSFRDRKPADTPSAAPVSATPAPALPKLDLEDLLGRRVLGWVGAIAVLLGIVFFLATAIRRGWIDEATRVVLAYLGSSALLLAGAFLYERRGRTQAALAGVAAAIAGLYLSTIAATQLYDLVHPTVGLGVAALVGAAGTAIAVSWESPIVGAVGIVGAILSPPLVGAGTSGASLAFMALALGSATGIVVWQRWNWLAGAAFVTSAPQLLGWIDSRDDEGLPLTLAVLAAFWAVYVVGAIGYELRVPTETLRLSSASLLLTDAVLVSGIGWLVLDDAGHGDLATLWVVAAALVHVLLGVTTLRGSLSREVALLALAIGVGLSAIGVALALDGPALVAAWAVEAALLTWLAARTGESRGYLFAAGFLALSVGHALAIDAPPRLLEADRPVASAVVAVLLVAGAAFASAALYRGSVPEARWLAQFLGAAALAYVVPLAFDGLPVVVAWAALAVAASRAGGDRELAAPAYLALAAAHVLAFEAPPDALREGVDDLLVAAAALAVVIAAALGVARLAARAELRRVVEIAGAVALVYLPSVAIVDVTTSGELDPGQTPQVLLSAFWSLTGLAALVAGLRRDERRLRVGGLALLGVAIVKVYLFDLASLDDIYRVLSFIALGLLLLAAAFAYQRVRNTPGSG